MHVIACQLFKGADLSPESGSLVPVRSVSIFTCGAKRYAGIVVVRFSWSLESRSSHNKLKKLGFGLKADLRVLSDLIYEIYNPNYI